MHYTETSDRVKVAAPNCVIYEPKEYVFLLHPDRDSAPYFFQLAAQKKGRIPIAVTAYQEGDMVAAHTRVRIDAYTEVEG